MTNTNEPGARLPLSMFNPSELAGIATVLQGYINALKLTAKTLPAAARHNIAREQVNAKTRLLNVLRLRLHTMTKPENQDIPFYFSHQDIQAIIEALSECRRLNAEKETILRVILTEQDQQIIATMLDGWSRKLARLLDPTLN